jgi:glucosamine-6-phosphate deaminase
VSLFHLDEYIGIDADHPASFRRYLSERFVSRVGALKEVHFLGGESVNARAECARMGSAIGRRTVDLALVGIGNNGHLAFNDPPADFETDSPFIVVELDEVCRRQQLGEGWFAELEEVPRRAITMSIGQIMKSRSIVAPVPERRKAAAVKCALEGPITPDCPASILRTHSSCSLFLDTASAGLLSGAYRGGN